MYDEKGMLGILMRDVCSKVFQIGLHCWNGCFVWQAHPVEKDVKTKGRVNLL